MKKDIFNPPTHIQNDGTCIWIFKFYIIYFSQKNVFLISKRKVKFIEINF